MQESVLTGKVVKWARDRLGKSQQMRNNGILPALAWSEIFMLRTL